MSQNNVIGQLDNQSALKTDFDELTKLAESDDLKADLKQAKLESQFDKIKQEQARIEFDSSPIGLWQAAIRECVPPALSIVPDFALSDDETEALANGLAPALAKHFPLNGELSLPVEFTAIVTLYIVFNPKIQVMRAKKAEALKEVNPDAPKD